MQLAHQEEELGLCSGVCCDNLVHASQRRHARFGGRQVASQRLGRGVVGGPGVSCRLRSAACDGLKSAVAHVKVGVLAWAVVQHLHQRVVGVGKVRSVKEARWAPEEVVRMPIEAKLPFATFSASHVGGAEQQGLESCFDLGWHVWPTASGPNALPWTGNVHGLHELLGSGAGQHLQVRIKPLSADGGSCAFEQPHASHNVAHDRDDLRIVEATLGRGHIWYSICGKRVLVLLNVYESSRHLLEQHRAFSLEPWTAIAEPPLNVASRPCPCVEGIHRTFRWDGKSRRAHRQSAIGVGDSAFHCRLSVLAKFAHRGLHVEDHRLHALSASFVADRLKNAVLVLDLCCLLVSDDCCSVRLQCLDVAPECLHHLDGLDIMHWVHGDGSLCRVISRHVAMLVLGILFIRVLFGGVAVSVVRSLRRQRLVL